MNNREEIIYPQSVVPLTFRTPNHNEKLRTEENKKYRFNILEDEVVDDLNEREKDRELKG